MDANRHELIHKELAYQIIGAAMEVHGTLGSGFLEKVYQNALVIALSERGIRCQPRVPIDVLFHGKSVGEYIADILVEDQVILELKAVEALSDAHRAQVVNYLKATGLRLALLLNFGNATLEHKRVVL